jgi:cell division septation protein DedD
VAEVAIATPHPIAAPEVQQRGQPTTPVEVRPIVAQTNQASMAEPAYALSIVKQNVELPKVPVTKPAEGVANTPPARMWTVQVASVAVRKDAEKLASELRQEGYDAYVVTAQLDAKTWHRVRVGQLPRLKEALDLKKSLANDKQFKDPYVAAR